MFLTIKKQKQFNNQQGIALILSIIVLTNLLMITLIVTDVILRIGRSSQQISESEQAYYAAESGIERGLYQIEKNNDASSLGTIETKATGSLDQVDANWETYVAALYSTPVTCVNHNNKITYYQVSSFNDFLSKIGPEVAANSISCLYAEDFSSDIIIRYDNALVVLLEPGKSFELDLNINVADSNFYPNQLNLKWEKPNIPSKQTQSDTVNGKIIVLNGSEQSITDTNNANASGITLPATGQFGSNPEYRIRIINNEVNDYGLYIFTPNGGTNNKYLPIGIELTSTGYYTTAKKKERIVQVERKNWQIY